MQIEGRKLIFIMNFSVQDFFKFASRMPQIAQILVLTFKNFPGGACPRTPLDISSFFSVPMPGSVSPVSKAKSALCCSVSVGPPKLPVGIHQTGPCLAAQSVKGGAGCGCGWGFKDLCLMDIHLNGKFSVCGGGRGVDSVQSLVLRL